jgi:hypothetical protein
MLTHKQTMQFNNESMRGVDMTEQLRLYHTKDERFKGLIYDHAHQPVVSNFPMHTEYTFPEQATEFASMFRDEPWPVMLYEAIEGSLIRVYQYNDEWHLSTSSRIDAFQSTWASSQSFGSQFEEFVVSISGVPLDVFLCSLRPERKYYFLLPTAGINRLGKEPDAQEPRRIYLVAVETLDHQLWYGPNLPRDETNLWSYAKSWAVSSMEEWLGIAQHQNLSYYRSPTEIVRCQTSDYARRCALRNNEMNLFYRYLQLYHSKDWSRCEELGKMYPEIDFSRWFEQSLTRTVYALHHAYVQRYIDKQRHHLPKSMHILLRKCHGRYLERREKTTPTVIEEILVEQEPRHILTLFQCTQHIAHDN